MKRVDSLVRLVTASGMPSPPLPLGPQAQDRLERLGQEFLLEVLRRETERHPENVEALAELAHVLTRLGRLEEGLATDARLVELAPRNPTVHYNLACSLALLGRFPSALDALEKAVELGYDDLDHLMEDGDLASLRSEERFQRLIEHLRKVAGA